MSDSGEIWSLTSTTQILTNIIPSAAELIKQRSRCIVLPPVGLNAPLWSWVLWNLWKTRNKLVFENKDYTAQEIINKSIKDAKEWNYAQTDQTDVSRLGPPSWKVSTRSVCPPTSFQSGVLVCKVDAAWEATTGRCGIGGIFSGGEVQTLSTVSEAFSHVSSALMAEAIVIHCAVSLAVYSNARSLAVLTDFLSMINLLKTKRHQPELFDIMFDIYHFISLFDVITFD